MLNLNNLFTAIGRIGRELYVINQSQSLQPVPYNELSALSFMDQFWINQLTQTYDQGIRQQSSSMSPWVNAAIAILQNMVSQVDPSFGTSQGNALQYLLNQMNIQGATVKQYNTGYSSTPDITNVGKGVIFATLIRGDGFALQNVIPETGTILITADSYLGGTIAGQEPWQYLGQPNASSLGTGIQVGIYDWDFPTGSGVITSGNCIAANQYASTSRNFLTNGDFATWTGSPAAPSNWNLVTGTWGTSVQQNNTNQLGGNFCVQFNAGFNNELTQQFGSVATTGATAGTGAPLSAYVGFAGNLFFRAAGAITGGTATVLLVNSSGAVINDQQGNPNQVVINLATVPSTGYQAYSYAFRTPIILPADGIIRLDIKITGLTGANLYFDWTTFTIPSNLYTGGPNIVVFSRPDAVFVAQPEPDNFNLTFTNDFGGSVFLASFQSLFSRLYQTPGLILPNAASPTISDTLITAV